MSLGIDSGWVALAGQWVTIDGETKTIYNWDGRFWPNRAGAIAAGTELANGTDDFNLAFVEGETVFWWGWMTEAHPITHADEAADQFGWTVAEQTAEVSS